MQLKLFWTNRLPVKKKPKKTPQNNEEAWLIGPVEKMLQVQIN